MLDKLHDDAVTILIARDLLTSHPEMEKNIGKEARFIPRWKKSHGTNLRDYPVRRIIGVQLDWKGNPCYRVLNEALGDTFGMVADPSEWVVMESAVVV